MKNVSPKSVTLKEWIDDVGVLEVARLTKVGVTSVRHWRRGFCLPRTEQMYLIMKYSKGTVSANDVIRTHHAPKTSRR